MDYEDYELLSQPKILKLGYRFVCGIFEVVEQPLSEVEHRHAILPTPWSEIGVITKRQYAGVPNLGL